MSEYRRFISYIYKYQRGQKQNNCGYAKVEIRNGVFRLRMHLQPAGKSAQELQVYGFVRRKGSIYGILLGNVGLKNFTYDFQTVSQAARIGGSEYTADDLRGLWLRGPEENYITIWDDEPVAVEQFTDKEPEEETAQEQVKVETAQKQVKAETAQKQVKAETAQEQTKEAPAADVQVQSGQTGTLAGRWQNFLQHYPRIYPFTDEEITQCISITPKDLSFLQKEEWQFGKNTFLRQAYMQYHHLMLGCHAGGRFVLGVPGSFRDMQEKHLARMYGFPHYKEAAAAGEGGEDLQAGERKSVTPEGYWYHFLNETCPGKAGREE